MDGVVIILIPLPSISGLVAFGSLREKYEDDVADPLISARTIVCRCSRRTSMNYVACEFRSLDSSLSNHESAYVPRKNS